jgi:hypothetical protein
MPEAHRPVVFDEGKVEMWIELMVPIASLLALLVLAVASMAWGVDTVSASLQGPDGRAIRWAIRPEKP